MLPLLSTFPVLTTERLMLRQPTASEAPELLMLRSSPLVNQYLERKPAESLTDATSFIKQVNANFAGGDGLYWAIVPTDAGKLISTICLFSFSTEVGKCAIGFELLPAYQGQGIMNEVLKKVVQFAFQALPVKCIEACTHPENNSSNQLLRKLGFKESLSTGDALPNSIIFRLPGEV